MRNILFTLGLLLASAAGQSQTSKPPACPEVLKTHSLEPLMGGKAVPLCAHAGKTILVVNTASKCGFTPQYEGLEKLHKTYGPRGLVVLGIPANDFGAQEPGSNAQIADFCKVNFGVSFFMADKLDQPIPKTPMFVGFATAASPAKPSYPQWNFHKYLIHPNGQVQSFDSSVEPMSVALTKAIETALPIR